MNRQPGHATRSALDAGQGTAGIAKSGVRVPHAGCPVRGSVACSLVARRRGRGKSGIVLSYVAATAATAAGYLGGHLTVARQVGSRDAAYR